MNKILLGFLTCLAFTKSFAQEVKTEVTYKKCTTTVAPQPKFDPDNGLFQVHKVIGQNSANDMYIISGVYYFAEIMCSHDTCIGFANGSGILAGKRDSDETQTHFTFTNAHYITDNLKFSIKKCD